MNNRGFTLLEVIIAIFVLLVGITATSVLISRTVSQMSISSSRLIAAYLTQEGIEIVRNIRDTSWLKGEAWDADLVCSTPPCDWLADYTTTSFLNDCMFGGFNCITYDGRFLEINSDGFYNHLLSGTETKFKRKITIDPVDSDTLEVTVETTWTEKGKDYSHRAQEILYNWK